MLLGVYYTLSDLSEVDDGDLTVTVSVACDKIYLCSTRKIVQHSLSTTAINTSAEMFSGNVMRSLFFSMVMFLSDEVVRIGTTDLSASICACVFSALPDLGLV